MGTKGAEWLGRTEARRRSLAAYGVGEELEVAHTMRFGDQAADMEWRAAYARAYRTEIQRRQGEVSHG